MAKKQSEPAEMYLRGADGLPLLKYFNILQNRYKIQKCFATNCVCEYFDKTPPWINTVDDEIRPLPSSSFHSTSLPVIVPFTAQFPSNAQPDFTEIDSCTSLIRLESGSPLLSQKASLWNHCSPSSDDILDLDCKCVLIASMTPRSDSFETLLYTFTELRKRGKKVIAVSSNPNVALLDNMYYFPSSFLSESQDINYALAKWNAYLKAIQKKEYPDILLVEVPGVLMKSDLTGNHYLGIEAYAISQVLTPDYAICCAPINLYREEFWKRFNSVAKHKFGFPINAVQVSNLIVNPKMNIEAEDRYLRTSQTVINPRSLPSQSSILFFDVQTGGCCDHLIDNLVACIERETAGEILL